jgi:hypothetical protein
LNTAQHLAAPQDDELRPDPPVAASTPQGPDGLAASLTELLEPLRDASQVRVDFKVFRVDVSSDEEIATTNAYYEASARTANGIIQQTARWICTWDHIRTDSPRLLSVASQDFEEVFGNSSGPESPLRLSSA